MLSSRIAFRSAASRALIQLQLQQQQQHQQRRAFSVVRSLRNFGRSFEKHPFGRLPATTDAAPVDWGRMARRAGRQLAIYVPALSVLFGWPLMAKTVLNGHV